MEAVAEKPRKGNPNFGKKKANENDLDKLYIYELIQTYEQYKPVEASANGRNIKEYGKPASLYPPVYGLVNSGVAWDEETGKQRAWRFITTEESIWVDEQREYSRDEEAHILAQTENYLMFLNGRLEVRGVDKNKIKAIEVQDEFEGKKRQLRSKPRLYRLLNPEAEVKEVSDSIEREIEALNLAKNATLEEMYSFAHALGIDITKGEAFVKKDFLVQARSNPEFFLKHFVNPMNKFLFVFSMSLRDNEITTGIEANKLHWSGNRAYICDVNGAGNVAEELAKRALKEEPTIVKLYNTLKDLS